MVTLLTDPIAGVPITASDLHADLGATLDRIAWCEARLAETPGVQVLRDHLAAMEARSARLRAQLRGLCR